jgi:dihydroorotate dehydrogenase
MLMAIFSLTNAAYKYLRPLLFCLDPETAHKRLLQVLAAMPYCGAMTHNPADAVQIGSLNMPSAVGLAAGFDKNAQAPDAWFAHGCGFVEVGTVTPLPQQGNPLPRLFRLPEDRAVINRMGFNNDGAAAVRQRLQERRHRGGIIGANIGANKDSAKRMHDYVQVLEALLPFVDYITVNISSPNTPQLRDLQTPQAISQLFEQLRVARGHAQTPLWLKLAPDFPDDESFIASVTAAQNAGAQALIISNTTTDRPSTLQSSHASQSGGLSGAPLFEKTHRLVALAYANTTLPIIAVGGIDTPQKAVQMRQAGATAVQLYTGLVYEGPALIMRCVHALRGVPLPLKGNTQTATP